MRFKETDIEYYEIGAGPSIILLHGLFGALSNFEHLMHYFKESYTLLFPILPLYNASFGNATVNGMVEYVEKLISIKKLQKFHLVGNSLGGHIALLYALKNPSLVQSITLTGSSGLFENSLGGNYPNRGSYAFVEEKTKQTFYDPATATKELVDEVYEIVNNRLKALRIVRIAKSAIHQNLKSELPKIDIPVNLIWGKNDSITPPFVAEAFHEGIKNSEIHFIDKCGHAAMMERPNEFNTILEQFLNSIQLNKKV